MQEIVGDLWDFHQQGQIICIPTNVGWKKNGENVMGRGVAQQAAEKMPDLTCRYGYHCMQKDGGESIYYEDLAVIMTPTKPLNKEAPHKSWQGQATLVRVEESLWQLRVLAASIDNLIYLPLLGCGNGGLYKNAVLPIIRGVLTSSQFQLVLQH